MLPMWELTPQSVKTTQNETEAQVLTLQDPLPKFQNLPLGPLQRGRGRGRETERQKELELRSMRQIEDDKNK